MKITQEISLLPKQLLAGLRPSHPWARTMVHNRLGKINQGCLRLHEQDRLTCFGEAPEQTDLVVDIHVHHPDFFTDLAFGGSVGAGESYMSGHWTAPNLTGVVRLFGRNLAALDHLDRKQSLLARSLLKVFHWVRRNTPSGSRKNIAAHYDLGNDFFQLFLEDRKSVV